MDLDLGEALLCAVLDRAPAAFGQVAGSVLGLGLHQDLQLLAVNLRRVLARQETPLHQRNRFQGTAWHNNNV